MTPEEIAKIIPRPSDDYSLFSLRRFCSAIDISPQEYLRLIRSGANHLPAVVYPWGNGEREDIIGSALVDRDDARTFLESFELPPVLDVVKSLFHDRSRKGLVYFLQAQTGEIKIGRTEGLGGSYSRMANHQSSNPRPLMFIGVIKDAGREREIHRTFSRYQIDTREWFDGCQQEIVDFVTAEGVLVGVPVVEFDRQWKRYNEEVENTEKKKRPAT